jgi:hypothetical protein
MFVLVRAVTYSALFIGLPPRTTATAGASVGGGRDSETMS